MLLIMLILPAEAAADPMNAVNVAGKVTFLQSKENENGTERIRIYKRNVRTQFEDDENSDVKFPWDISILGEIRDLTVELLREKGYPVCDPCIVCDEPNRYCNLEECYMHSCNLHP